jgi:hypothetical protein
MLSHTDIHDGLGLPSEAIGPQEFDTAQRHLIIAAETVVMRAFDNLCRANNVSPLTNDHNDQAKLVWFAKELD